MTPNEMERRVSPKWPVALGLAAVLILVGGFGSWAAMTQIAGAIVAAGRVEVDQNRQVVQHPDGGVVEAILVREGDVVEEGQPLLRLDPTILKSKLALLETEYFELLARRGRLEAERDGAEDVTFPDALVRRAAIDPAVAEVMQGQERFFRTRAETNAQEVEQLRRRADQIREQIGGVLAQQKALERQLELIESELKDQRRLRDQGLTQASRVLALEREAARLAGSVGELVAQRASAEGRITEIELEIIKKQSQRSEQAIAELRDIQFRERSLEEQMRALREQLSRMEITAPVSGVVYGLAVTTERAVVRPAEPIMYIIPQDRPLVISARVPTIHVDQLYPGQPVFVRFPAFSSRRTPDLHGEVVQISADAFVDEVTNESFYRVRIALAPGELERLPDGARLVPGMPVETFIRTRERTPLAFLIGPFTDYFSRAFREG